MIKESTGTNPNTRALSVEALDSLKDKGFKFVQVKGLTLDKHFDYVDPHFLVLIPCRELPTDPSQKDIYEPIKSKLLRKWAKEINVSPEIVISMQ